MGVTLICACSCIVGADAVAQDAVWRERGGERVMNDPSRRRGRWKEIGCQPTRLEVLLLMSARLHGDYLRQTHGPESMHTLGQIQSRQAGA